MQTLFDDQAEIIRGGQLRPSINVSVATVVGPTTVGNSTTVVTKPFVRVDFRQAIQTAISTNILAASAVNSALSSVQVASTINDLVA